MENTRTNSIEKRAMGLAILVYCAVTLVGFVIGLYGLFSLLSLALNTLERSSRMTGSLF